MRPLTPPQNPILHPSPSSSRTSTPSSSSRTSTPTEVGPATPPQPISKVTPLAPNRKAQIAGKRKAPETTTPSS